MRTFNRILATTLLSYAVMLGNASAANLLEPSTVFVQAGAGDEHTSAYIAGVSWDLPWHKEVSFGTFGAYTELAFGRWQTNDSRGDSTVWPTQISFTPVLRYFPGNSTHWFTELGIGANYIVPIFHSGDKRFSTAFNFGDHFAVGRTFGRSEVSLRIQHFSNGGISEPNPGENFLQLRYAYRL